jgi:hypothetical protein
MTDRDLDRVNASGAVDFAVESAGPDRLVVVGFVDQPGNLRARIVFEQILCVQMPWRFSFRVIEQRSLTTLLVDEPGRRHWDLPDHMPTHASMPSLSVEEARDACAQGHSVFAFVSRGSSPADPSCYVVAASMKVILPEVEDDTLGRVVGTLLAVEGELQSAASEEPRGIAPERRVCGSKT